MSIPEIGIGDIEINLDGETVILRPSLAAAMTLSRMNGGISTLVNKCLGYDFDVILAVVVAGIGRSSKDLPEKVYKTGLIQLAPSCIKFLHVVANGGQPVGADDSGEPTKQGEA